MADSWIDSPLQPLRLSVPDFEVRRLRAFERAAAIARSLGTSERRLLAEGGVGNELWVESGDGLVGGYIDCVFAVRDDLIIRDYKTGAVLEPDGLGTVKEAYENQLKLYAALYHASFDRWPTRLELVPLRGAPIALSFTHEECLLLLRSASDLLNRTNDRIEALNRAADPRTVANSLATPAPSFCRFCAYRPACPVYHEARKTPAAEKWPADVLGDLEETRTLGNGRLSLSIADPSFASSASVRGIDPDPDRHPALRFLAARRWMAICNLRPGANPQAFSETSATVLYVTSHECVC